MVKCSYCNVEIKEEYYYVGDNFIQRKYFDSEDENVFCSKNCLCESLSVDIVYIDNTEEKIKELTILLKNLKEVDLHYNFGIKNVVLSTIKEIEKFLENK